MHCTGKSRWLVGLLIIAFGTVLLLNNLGLTSIDAGSLISRFWPLILIYWGLNSISCMAF
ncbi:MAG: LiaF transmembrane domain-containing protein [Bacillota bacterium]